jgi:hypothetical protein
VRRATGDAFGRVPVAAPPFVTGATLGAGASTVAAALGVAAASTDFARVPPASVAIACPTDAVPPSGTSIASSVPSVSAS